MVGSIQSFVYVLFFATAFSRDFSGNSQANASELLENHDELFPHYYMSA